MVHGLPRLKFTLLVATLALAGSLLGPVAGAPAALVDPQLQSVPPLGGFSSDNKSLTATCPAGKRVVGGGGGIVPGPVSEVAVDAIRPDAGLTSVTVHGTEDEDGASFNWAVDAGAICAKAPPGLELITATSAADSSNKSVTATCPSGKQVFGTGG